MSQEKVSENEFVITREFNAPRTLLFKLWTDPRHLNQWWGPPGMKTEIRKQQLRPGGILHYHMKSPEGFEMWGKFVYREIVEPEKIVFVVSFSDAGEGFTRHPMSQTWPIEVLNTLIFTEQNGKTLLTLKGIPINATDEECKTFVEGFASMNQGWKGTLDKLEVYSTTIS